MSLYKTESRDRKIKSLTSKLPRKKTIKRTGFTLLTIGYIYLHYSIYSFFWAHNTTYLDSLLSRELPSGVTDGHMVGTTLFHILDICLIALYLIEKKRKISIFLNNVWELFPD